MLVMFVCEHGVTSISVTFIVLVSKPTSMRLWVIVCCIYVGYSVLYLSMCLFVCGYETIDIKLLALKDFCVGNDEVLKWPIRGLEEVR